MSEWTWVSAAARGTSHERSGTRLQDAQCCFVERSSTDQWFVGVISDGAGSAEFGGQGAQLTCRSVSTEARRFLRQNGTLPNRNAVEAWIDKTRDWIFAVAERRGKTPRDFASTLVCVLSNSKETVAIHIGDGAVVARDAATGDWQALSWPSHGEYASTTFFVVDDPFPNLMYARHESAVSTLVAFTDGLERLALDFQHKTPFEKFFNGVSRPLVDSTVPGRNAELCRSLATFLRSPAINNRTDDDKTLVMASWR